MAGDPVCPQAPSGPCDLVDRRGVKVCSRCGRVELKRRVIGVLEQNYAKVSPDAGATLDEMFGDAVITNEGNVELTSGMVQLTGPKAEAWTEYNAATIALRDGELAYRAAQERYRKALERLNESIAKVGP